MKRLSIVIENFTIRFLLGSLRTFLLGIRLVIRTTCILVVLTIHFGVILQASTVIIEYFLK